MKVSIIVPTLNRPRLLEKLIANVQATTLSDNYELILLVEDGDTETWNFLGANSFPSNIQVHSIPTSSSPIAAWNSEFLPLMPTSLNLSGPSWPKFLRIWISFSNWGEDVTIAPPSIV